MEQASRGAVIAAANAGNMKWPFSFLRNQSVRRWWPWVLAGWSTLILIQVTQSYTFSVEVGFPWNWTYSLRYAVVELFFWIIMTGVIVHWSESYSLEGAERRKNFAALLVLTGATLLIHAAYRVLLHHVMYNDPVRRPILHLFTFQLVDISLADAAVFWAIVGISQAIRSAQRAQQREHELTKAQLEMLKAQLQPHFLFNTLNSISWLMRKDVEAADNVIASLSAFLRTTLTVPGAEEVTLREELQVLNVYLAIEQARFQGRLNIIMNVDPDTLGCKVPGLLLQPMVENAVRHGVGRIQGAGRVEIGARREGPDLRLWILDNGPGMARPDAQREGIGMSNTRARLEKYYGQGQSLRFNERVEGGAKVDIRLPFRVSRDGEWG
ncbi:MAG TPA: histidine kinase [Candidatus Angelobacter sp.]